MKALLAAAIAAVAGWAGMLIMLKSVTESLTANMAAVSNFISFHGPAITALYPLISKPSTDPALLADFKASLGKWSIKKNLISK